MVGALVLAAVTSLPNAVAAVWLAARGLLLPAAVIGLGRPDGQTTLIAARYFGLTPVVLASA